MTVAVRMGLIVALAGAVACGKSPEQQRAEAIQKSAAEMQKSADQMQKGAQEMVPVDFHALQQAIPEVSGWERGTPTGERMTMPRNFAHASAIFTKGDAEIEEKITDSASNQLLITQLSMMLSAGYSRETSSGYEKATTIDGNPGFEKVNKSAKHATLTVVAKNRFIIEIEGRGVSDPKELRRFFARTDLEKLTDAN